jgi:GNAT superfamily N-acetyltransferase
MITLNLTLALNPRRRVACRFEKAARVLAESAEQGGTAGLAMDANLARIAADEAWRRIGIAHAMIPSETFHAYATEREIDGFGITLRELAQTLALGLEADRSHGPNSAMMPASAAMHEAQRVGFEPRAVALVRIVSEYLTEERFDSSEWLHLEMLLTDNAADGDAADLLKPTLTRILGYWKHSS